MTPLLLLVIVPLVGALVVAALPPARSGLIKPTALISSFATLVVAIALTLSYFRLIDTWPGSSNDSELRLLFPYSAQWFPSFGVFFEVGADGISIAMILLTAFVVTCGVLASWELEHRQKEFFALLLVLVAGVYGVFIAVDLFLLFLFYEVAVLPMYLLIGVWGTGRKEYSAMKLTLMLMAGSALILVGILGLYFESAQVLESPVGTLSINTLVTLQFPSEFQYWAFPVLFVGFGVIGALFPLHTWSPDGHASAPTAVSMLHAGVLMKLGGYGCLRAVHILPAGAEAWAFFFLTLATINIIYGAMIALRKTDLKYITAYSSVSHCGFVLFGLMLLTIIGIKGAVIQMFSHGVMTALFFALIGMLYVRTGTRELSAMGGLMKVLPFIGVSYFIGGLAALGLPGLSGFVAEITIFVGGWLTDDVVVRCFTVVACISIVVAAVYILRALTQLFFGPISIPDYESLQGATLAERLCAGCLVGLLLLVGLWPMWLVKMIEFSLEPVMANLTRGGLWD